MWVLEESFISIRLKIDGIDIRDKMCDGLGKPDNVIVAEITADLQKRGSFFSACDIFWHVNL